MLQFLQVSRWVALVMLTGATAFLQVFADHPNCLCHVMKDNIILPGLFQQAYNQYKGKMVAMHMAEKKSFIKRGRNNGSAGVPRKANVFQFWVNFAQNFADN